MKPIALVDMDGTVADFDGAMRRELALLRAPGEPETHDETIYEDVPHIKVRRRLIKGRPGFWRNLEPIQRGMDLVTALQWLGFGIHALTKGPRSTPVAWKEKVEWCVEHLPDAMITLTEDKSLVYGKVLADDWPAYYRPWLAHRPRGMVIVPRQPWNVEDLLRPEDQDRIIAYDGTGDIVTRQQEMAAICARLALQLSDPAPPATAPPPTPWPGHAVVLPPGSVTRELHDFADALDAQYARGPISKSSGRTTTRAGGTLRWAYDAKDAK